MAGGYTTPTGDQYEILVTELRKLGERLSELEIPTGTSMNSLVQQVQVAIADIDATVTAAIDANSYTKAQIDSKIASPGAITPSTVSTSGNVTVGAQFLNPDSATYNITGTRLTLWVETATGRHGNTASSRRYKQDEAPAGTDPRAVLSIEDKLFHYIAEIRKRDDPTYEEYVGPDYVVAEERGLMAEDLHEAGLSPWVIYREVDGEIVPESVDYVMWVVALQAVTRYLDARTTTLEADNAALTAAVADLTARVEALEARE